MPNYFSISIGPVIETLMSARKTRELWASSYILSYIMKNISAALEQKGFDLLLPSTKGINEQPKYGEGLYPDKIICVGEKGCSDIEAVIKHVLAELALQFEERFSEIRNAKYKIEKKRETGRFKFGTPFVNGDSLKFLIRYFNLQIAKFADPVNIASASDEIIFSLDEYPRLMPKVSPVAINGDGSENHDRNYPYYGLDPFRVFVNRINGSKLLRSAFTGMLDKKRFDSLLEISTRDLRYVNEEAYQSIVNDYVEDGSSATDSAGNDLEILTPAAEDASDAQMVEALKKEFDKHWKAYHKYICIIHADGDAVGKIVGQTGKSTESLKHFSSRMLQFARSATEIVHDYGGAPVYMGGDDLMFFAPLVVNKEQEDIKTLFTLINMLDKEFNRALLQDEKISQALQEAKKRDLEKYKHPSLSYGISITYYKYPLYQARSLSYSLLDAVKKEEVMADKNAINIMLQKHSGQQVPIYIPKGLSEGNTWKKIKKFLSTYTNKITDEAFLNSFTYKLETKRAVILDIMAEAEAAFRKERLDDFFKNNWNEVYKEYKQPFFDPLRDLMLVLEWSTSNDDDCKKQRHTFGLLYGVLRLVHFINSNDKD